MRCDVEKDYDSLRKHSLDSAHACLGLVEIKRLLEEHASICALIMCINNGGATLFRHQFLEVHRSECRVTSVTKWLFSGTGHDKSAYNGVESLVKHQAAVHILR